MKKRRPTFEPRTYNSTIFTEIYKRKFWGQGEKPFYSGTGSYNPLLKGYIDAVENFIISHDINSIVEIGCGDFNVTSKILKRLDTRNYPYHYLGYDVVKPLIKYNCDVYGKDHVKFTCKDSCTGILKKGDLLLIRQVLQHLRNKSIQQIVKKFKDYRFIIVTEHQPSEENLTIPNLDKNTDADIRMGRGSGVYLEKEPFNCEILSLMYMMPEYSHGRRASINTFLIKGGADPMITSQS